MPRTPFNRYGGGSLINKLSSTLTINDITQDCHVRFLGKQASASGWADTKSSTNYALIEGGDEPLYQQAGHVSGPDKSVKFNNGSWFQAPNTTIGQIETEDFVFEGIFKADTAALLAMSGTRTSGQGWMFYQNSGTFSLTINDTGGNLSANSAALTDATWYHVMVFGDRSGSMQIYINGVASGSAQDISTGTGTLKLLAMGLGSRAGGGLASNNNLSYFSIWKRAAWLDTHLQADLALARATTVKLA
jgi:hypothetical protein